MYTLNSGWPALLLSMKKLQKSYDHLSISQKVSVWYRRVLSVVFGISYSVVLLDLKTCQWAPACYNPVYWILKELVFFSLWLNIYDKMHSTILNSPPIVWSIYCWDRLPNCIIHMCTYKYIHKEMFIVLTFFINKWLKTRYKKSFNY